MGFVADKEVPQPRGNGGFVADAGAPSDAPVTPTPRQPGAMDVVNQAAKVANLATPIGLAAKGMELGNDLTSKVAYKAGGLTTDLLSKAGLSPEMAALGGYGVNVGVETIPMFVGGAIGRKAGDAAGKAVGRDWMQKALKPSPIEMESGRAQRGMETLLKEKTPIRSGGVDRLNKAIDDLQTEMIASLKGNPNVAEPHKVIKELDSVFDTYRKQATPNADLATIRKALNEFINHPLISKNGVLDLETANAIKSGTYKAIGEKGYGGALKPEAERDALKGIARGLQREIAAQPGIPQGIGARQAELINARDLLEHRLNRAGNTGELGSGVISPHWWQIPVALFNRNPYLRGSAAQEAYHGTLPAALGETAGGIVGASSGMAPTEKRK